MTSPTLRLARVLLPTLVALSGCSGGSSSPDKPVDPVKPAPKYQAEIRRTAFGIPHIKGSSEGDIGYGVGYAYAEDNLCTLAEEVITASGQRSRFFGPDGTRIGYQSTNLAADYFYRMLNDDEAVNQSWAAQPAEIKALVQGYVAGYNQYLKETGAANLPGECKGAPWLRELSELDAIRMMRRYAVEGSSGQFMAALYGAAPPGAPAARSNRTQAATPAGEPNVLSPEYWRRLHQRTGSNAVALGKDATDNGQGMLLGNPHFPWKGPLRFYQLHLTIPGKLDVMGAALGGMPLVNIGFNQNLAWSHTVNTSAHFTLHRLKLDPADPTRYLVDGQSKSMTKRTVTVDVKGADGVVKQQSRDFYSTEFGRIAVVPGVASWDRTTAYALGDANQDNHRLLTQWYAMDRAASLAEFKEAIVRTVGLPWVNTLAADKDGQALYLDVTAVPNISLAKQAACVSAADQQLAGFGIIILDGSRADCAWGVDPAAPQAGIFSGASLPTLTRSDFVQNSNDSAWLTNPAAPLVSFPAIVSQQGTEQSGRTRIGISQLQARLAGTDGLPGNRMSLAQLQQIALNNQVYMAQQVMDDVLKVCSGADLAVACAKLGAWDRSANLDANIGYAYFAGMWDRVRDQDVWAVPFDPADPVHTPRGLNLADAGVASAVRLALQDTVRAAAAKGWSPDAKWGDIQVAVRGAKKIPIHGGEDVYGVYNAITSVDIGGGLRDVTDGTSYIQAVTFDKNGPVAQAMLSYSQSSEPSSPYFADQTERFSRKAWITQPYTEAQITADPAYQTKRISMP
ncbi:acyl-homoserine lactone acylase PvdQ [Duganella caerulea]|uniref:bifunctional acylase PvdQ n=1 Tax=Duganella caerulea TaxID=2885762 RepID=UPI0030EAA5CB